MPYPGFAIMLALVACGQTSGASSDAAHVPIAVMSSISTFDSFITAVGGDRVSVSNLVPVGSSPEDYQPKPQDVEALASARILVENGAGLEAWLSRTIDDAKNDHLAIVVCSDGLPKIGANPHLWMDPILAKQYVAKIRDALIAADPADAATFRDNAARERARLDELAAWIRSRIATVPRASRAMIVFHNAWQYYDDRFGLRTVGVVELSPGQEPDPDYIAKLIGLAKANHVRAVFAEPEYSPKLIETLADSAGIATVQNLYDDSIGGSGPVRDYDSMQRYDTDTIVRALGGKP